MKELMPPGYLTSADAAAAVGVPYRQLMRWVEAGIVIPYTADSRKRSPRLWAADHLAQLRFVIQLRETFSHELVRAAMAAVRANPGADWLLLDPAAGEASAVRAADRIGKVMEGRASAMLIRMPSRKKGAVR